MIQTDAQEQEVIVKSSYKPNKRTPGLLSCYGMIFKWAKVIQNPYIKQETIKIDRNQPGRANHSLMYGIVLITCTAMPEATGIRKKTIVINPPVLVYYLSTVQYCGYCIGYFFSVHGSTHNASGIACTFTGRVKVFYLRMMKQIFISRNANG